MGLDNEQLHAEDERPAEDFECVICRDIASQPQCCGKCSKLFCTECIDEWLKKNKKCPFKCSVDDMNVVPLSPESITAYMQLRFKCNRGCGKFYPLINYLEHITICKLPDCDNINHCKKKTRFLFNGINVCSFKCFTQKNAIDKQIELSHDELYTQGMKECENKKEIFENNFPVMFDFKNAIPFYKPLQSNSFEFYGKEDQFNTVLSSVGIVGGIHKFKIKYEGNNNDIKLGVTKDIENKHLDTAFCNDKNGYAYYTLGQTRNGSARSGLLFGDRLDKASKHELIMELSMGEGKLSFIINGTNYGIAFEEEELKEGPIRLAVALRGNVKKMTVNSV